MKNYYWTSEMQEFRIELEAQGITDATLLVPVTLQGIKYYAAPRGVDYD